MIRSAVAMSGVLALGVSLGAGERMTYENDFSERTSSAAMPSGAWERYDYQLGAVAYGYMTGSYAYTPDMPWANPSKMQDGWIRGAYATYSASPSVRTDGVDETKRFLGFNLNSGDTTIYRGYAYQPIRNSFTNGLVEYHLDMRAPSGWLTPVDGKTPLFRFAPAYRTFLRNPDAMTNPLNRYPLMCGVQRSGDNATSQIMFVGGDKNGSPEGTGFKGWSKGHWYRLRATVNLDSHTVTLKAWDLGTDVPTWSSAGTALKSDNGNAQESKNACCLPTGETGPLDGIGFYVSGVNPKNELAKMPLVTNIRVAWKAPGTDDFVPCYSNDFTTCWRRRLQPGSFEHAYSSAATGVREDVFDSYVDEKQVVVSVRGADPSKTLQPVGVDGWRRASGWAAAKPVVARVNDSDKVLKVTQVGSNIGDMTANLTQPLGRKCVLGKMAAVDRLIYSINMRTPKRWGLNTNQFADAYLGDELLYTKGCNDDVAAKGYVAYTTHRAASAGLKGKNQYKGDTYPYGVDNSTSVNADTVNCPSGTWYRIVISADLKGRTYDYTLWKLGQNAHYGSTATPSGKVYSMTGLAMRDGVEDISCFGFRAYATGSSDSDAILVDNLNVSTVVGATTNLIYRNLFSLRRRYDVPARVALADANNVTSDVCDNWIRRSDPTATLDVREKDGNRFAAVAAVGDNLAFAVQNLASPLKAELKNVISVDIRPPQRWVQNTSTRCWAQLLLGDAEFAQADVYGTTAAPQAKAAMRIGFTNGGNKSSLLGQYTNVCATVRNGDSNRYFPFKVNTSSWYRFVVATRPQAKKFDVAIYELGDTPSGNGTKVGSATGLAYDPEASGDGISAMALMGVGMADQSPYDAASPDIALFDNVKIGYRPSGLSILVQ